jgi:hypothetical protein
MKTAIIICTFNRPLETAACFATLRNADIIPGTVFIIVDDCSTDAATLQLVREFHIEGCQTIHISTAKNSGIYVSLYNGYNTAFDLMNCEIAMNLDNDALVNNHFQIELLKLKSIWQNNIVTGFNCATKNNDGSERHKQLGGGAGYNYKASVGGINMVVHRKQYIDYMLPALEECMRKPTNWDALTCINSMADNKPIVCLQPSVIQHQATQSSMGHNERPDTAEDFKGLTLKDVTLVCVDDDADRGISAILKCKENANFGECVLITSTMNHEAYYNPVTRVLAYRSVHIPPLLSKEAYSRFIMNELFNYIATSHVLIIQHDGYITNWQAWDKTWLQYDYIGAPWPLEYIPNRVGNGGFSLRSQKLLRTTAGINWPVTHPEDAVICRELRPILEREHGIKFAPLEVAEKFSYEGYNQPGAYNGQFGVHGPKAVEQAMGWKSKLTVTQWRTGDVPVFNDGIQRTRITSQPQFGTPSRVVQQAPVGLIFNQFLGLGDILFLIPLARHYMALGHDIVWPVADEYQPDLKRHFPDIQFVHKRTFPMDYERQQPYMHRWQYGNYKVLPFRWNKCNTVAGSDAMTGKYTMIGEDWRMWRGLKWERSPYTEGNLRIATGAHGEYELHCTWYGCGVTGQLKQRRVQDSGLRIISLTDIKGFSLLSWSAIFENATIIHAVSSSTLYMLETLELKAKELHLYGRDKGMKDIDYVRPLLTKEYIFHE